MPLCTTVKTGKDMNQPKRIFISRYKKPLKFWLLRFRFNGKVIHRENFRDDKYGSRKKALAAAIKKRDRIAHCVNLDLTSHWHTCRVKNYRYTQKRSTRNSTGVIGVARWQAASGTVYYRASCCLDKYRETVRSFNAKILGEEEAFHQTIKQRKAWERQLLNQ